MLKCTKLETYILRMEHDRPVLFTPNIYDARTGILHGNDDGGKPVSISIGRSLTPYQPVELEWEDD